MDLYLPAIDHAAAALYIPAVGIAPTGSQLAQKRADHALHTSGLRFEKLLQKAEQTQMETTAPAAGSTAPQVPAVLPHQLANALRAMAPHQLEPAAYHRWLAALVASLQMM